MTRDAASQSGVLLASGMPPSPRVLWQAPAALLPYTEPRLFGDALILVSFFSFFLNRFAI
jgi:hypothetical protein